MQVGLIGSLTATKNASDAYTLDALTDNDGVGRWNDSTLFAYPQGQNGSASGTWFHDGTGTEPIFNGAYNYTVSRDGYIYAYAQLQVCTTGGTGTASAYLTLPIRRNAGINNNQHSVMMYNAGTTSFEPANALLLGADSHWVGLYNSVISGAILTLNDIDTNDQLYVDMNFLATKTQ